ncbi:MAG: serine hydrolase [Saprospiraceae bacterium]|nr:serine hydrolase [Saprospiraceae bacterium]
MTLENPVAKSLNYQPWEQTAQPEGSAAFLGLGSFAKVLCTAIFESKRDPVEAATHSGKIILAEEYQDEVKYFIDYEQKQVKAFLGDSVLRTASFHGDQGCSIDGPSGLHFYPRAIQSILPPADELTWPMGDLNSGSDDRYPVDLLDSVLEAAFEPHSLTAAFLVIHKGKIILEKYAPGITKNTQLESWSMGKSLTATLIGRMMQMGKLTLDQPAPVEEWQSEGDPRKKITIRDLMQMSSGLRFPAHRDPEVKVPLAKLAHMYIYCDAINIFDFSVNRPLEFVPGTTGRYRNCDPLTLGYILRNSIEADQNDYLSWPQKELFDKIGIRHQLLETDPYGNFIMTGFDYGTARNWGRLGLLYLQDGVWLGQRLLPEGFTEFVSTPAASWDQPIYGGLFWLNGTGELDLPKDTYYMAGGGGQRTIICPSLDLVVVRLGHSEGGDYADKSLNKALGYLKAAL